jgi:nucleotide-binding universal stress UspA family protein
MIQLKSILCPTDFSEYSRNALRYALALAGAFGAKVILLHVIEPIQVPVEYNFGISLGPEIDESSEAALRRKLHDLVDIAHRATVDVEERLVRGAPFAEIVRCARDEKIDLVVIATHGLSGIAHLLLGSTAEKVVRKAPCPVLTVKHPEHEFVMP